MSTDLIQAAARLTELLERENAALSMTDLAAAAALLPQKQTLAAAFMDAQAAAPETPLPANAARRLHEVVEENRRLLERGISVQGKVVELIGGAVQRSVASSCYSPKGFCRQDSQVTPFALSARA